MRRSSASGGPGHASCYALIAGSAALVVRLPARSPQVFAFYSNRIGCAGSILVSLIGTVILATVIWMLNS